MLPQLIGLKSKINYNEMYSNEKVCDGFLVRVSNSIVVFGAAFQASAYDADAAEAIAAFKAIKWALCLSPQVIITGDYLVVISALNDFNSGVNSRYLKKLSTTQ